MLKKFNKKAVVIMVTAVCSYGYIPSSNAILPVTDFAVLSETLAGNIQSLNNWIEEKVLMKMDMAQNAVLQAAGVDAGNNQATQQIQSAQNMQHDISEIELKRVTSNNIKDGATTCATLGVQAMAGAVSCDAATTVKKSMAGGSATHGNFGSSKNEHIEQVKEITKKTVNDCKLLQIEGAPVQDPNDPGASLRYSACMTPIKFLGSDSNSSTLTDDDAKAADYFSKLIVGVTPTFKKSSLIAKDSSAYYEQVSEEASLEAYRNLVNLTFSEAKALKTNSTSESDPSPSPMAVLDEFDDERFGNIEWMASVQNINAETKNEIQPAEVLRQIAVMEAFMVHLELLKYKQQIRMESLQAALLAVTINPPKP
jgi:hypothetical protein